MIISSSLNLSLRKNTFLTHSRSRLFGRSINQYRHHTNGNSRNDFVFNLLQPYDELQLVTSKLLGRRVYLVGESHIGIQEQAVSAIFSDLASQNKVTYFHEGVPSQEPYQSDYITNFYHRSMLHKKVRIESKGSNYGLENIDFFIPHYFALYYHYISDDTDSATAMIPTAFSDLVYIRELHPSLNKLSCNIQKIGKTRFALITLLWQGLNNEFKLQGMNSKELLRLKPILNEILLFINHLIKHNNLHFENHLELSKGFYNNYKASDWALLIKGLLQIVVDDVDLRLKLPFFLKSSYKKIIDSPGDSDEYKSLQNYSLLVRDELFVDRLCEIVPSVPLDQDVVVSLGTNHVTGVATLLKNLETKTKTGLIMPSSWTPHLSAVMEQ